MVGTRIENQDRVLNFKAYFTTFEGEDQRDVVQPPVFSSVKPTWATDQRVKNIFDFD